MQLIYTDKHFTIEGKSYISLPILIDENCEIVNSAFRFLIYLSVQDARVQSMRTINSYASTLLDYFSFLSANHICWDTPYLKTAESFSLSVLSLYRNWSRQLMTEQGNREISDSTINLRLSVLKRFYLYCYESQLINFKPWETLYKIQPEPIHSFLRHTRGQRILKSNDLALKVFKKSPKLLSLEQCKLLMNSINNRTLKLMTKLILSTGLRKDEIISFSKANIFEPNLNKINLRIPVELIPHKDEQRTKGSKPRTIFISVPLMKELYDYIHFGEGAIRAGLYESTHGKISSILFLNKFGRAFSETSLNGNYYKLFKCCPPKITFRVTPHMLRHTYATIELYAESQRTNTMQALSWVKERLGHTSISTTSVYLHCIESLHEHELSSYQKEIDMMG